MKLTPFETIYATAAKRKGGEDALEALMPTVKKPAALKKIGDDRYLSAMTRSVFQAGFAWSVIEKKWDGFEAAFRGFDPLAILSMSDTDADALASDTRIVRNWPKIKTVFENAEYVTDVAQEHGSFGAYVAAWPTENIVGLWEEMQRRGSRLGGMSGPYTLRFMGKDTFMLSRDVVAFLMRDGVIDSDKTTSKKARTAIQTAFNTWADQSGRPMAHISRIIANSLDA